VFHNRAAQASPDVQIVTVSAAYIANGDGVSNTFLLAENADAARWTGGPEGTAIVPAERWMGFTWHQADGEPGDPSQRPPLEPLAINVRRGESRLASPQSPAMGFARPSSHHAGGVFMAFCNGRVRFVSEQISYRVYQALMTPCGSDAMYVSQDANSPLQRLPPNHAARQTVTDEDLNQL
jgi:hypothetical protein